MKKTKELIITLFIGLSATAFAAKTPRLSHPNELSACEMLVAGEDHVRFSGQQVYRFAQIYIEQGQGLAPPSPILMMLSETARYELARYALKIYHSSFRGERPYPAAELEAFTLLGKERLEIIAEFPKIEFNLREMDLNLDSLERIGSAIASTDDEDKIDDYLHALFDFVNRQYKHYGVDRTKKTLARQAIEIWDQHFFDERSRRAWFTSAFRAIDPVGAVLEIAITPRLQMSELLPTDRRFIESIRVPHDLILETRITHLFMDFARLKPDSSLVFFLSGHGISSRALSIEEAKVVSEDLEQAIRRNLPAWVFDFPSK